MVSVSTIVTFDLFVGGAAALGLLYLLYSETFVVHYRRFFRLITLGLLAYAVTGPVIDEFAPAYVHAVHGFAALCITLGLADLLRTDARSNLDPDFGVLLDAEPPGRDPEAGVGTGTRTGSERESESISESGDGTGVGEENAP